MKEEWKDINGYEGSYTISNKGRVKSFKGTRGKAKGFILKSYPSRNYYYITLSKHTQSIEKRKKIKVSRLVAQHFIPNPENKPCVNHIDGDKLNDNVTNLEWATYSENMFHALDMGLNKRRQSVEQLDKDTGKVLATYKSITAAANAVGLKQDSHISAFARGKLKSKHIGGYHWRLVNIQKKGMLRR
jgi:hypothetical protein